MPETATITSYYSFSAGTRAKSSQVNANLLNHRGHVIPIDPNTATAANNTYDVGSSDHQWRDGYFQNTPKVNNVQLNKFEIRNLYDGTSPPSIVEMVGALGRIGFSADLDQDVFFDFVVPPQYRVGQRISLNLKGYPETTGSCVFYSTAYLYRTGTTTITGSSTPAAVLTGTATIANAAAGLFQEDTQLKLTDSGGLINGATVSVGDVIAVQLKRPGLSAVGDTNTGKWFLTNLTVDLNL